MKNRSFLAITLVSVLFAVFILGGWYQAHQALQAARLDRVASTLEPINALIKENQATLLELQAEPFAEKDSGILESYLIKLRRDGVATSAPMKQRLDSLAENNSEILALLTAYGPQSKTAGFTSATNKFRSYAIAWRDRWNSVIDLFMAGGNYPTSGMPFPVEFPAAVNSEIENAR
jgi:hypothetical protein